MSARRPIERLEVPRRSVPTRPVPPMPSVTSIPQARSLEATTAAVRCSS